MLYTFCYRFYDKREYMVKCTNHRSRFAVNDDDVDEDDTVNDYCDNAVHLGVDSFMAQI